jgi:hypothetical protein
MNHRLCNDSEIVAFCFVTLARRTSCASVTKVFHVLKTKAKSNTCHLSGIAWQQITFWKITATPELMIA